jgi:hypothetical protein
MEARFKSHTDIANGLRDYDKFHRFEKLLASHHDFAQI